MIPGPVYRGDIMYGTGGLMVAADFPEIVAAIVSSKQNRPALRRRAVLQVLGQAETGGSTAMQASNRAVA